MPLDRCGIEQRRRVAKGAADAVLALGQRQLEVELGHIVRKPSRLGLQPRQDQPGLLGVLPSEHDLEQRRVIQTPRRLDDLDHLLEGQILVVLRVQGGPTHPSQHFAHSRLTRQVEPQGQRVHEEADQPLRLRPATVGRRRADDEVVLTGQPSEHRGPSREHGHEQGHAVLPAQILERPGQAGLDAHRERAAGEGLLGRTRTVGRQGEQDRRIRQNPAPVSSLGLEALAAEPAALPSRVVRVLKRQRCQRVRAPLAEGGVQRPEFPEQHGGRPAVGDDVVLGQHEDMVGLSQTDQAAADQGPSGQIERDWTSWAHSRSSCTSASAAPYRSCRARGRPVPDGSSSTRGRPSGALNRLRRAS